MATVSSKISYEELAELVKNLPPMTEQQKRECRFDWVYGNLACSTNHKPTRSAFLKLALDDGWSETEFNLWAKSHRWFG